MPEDINNPAYWAERLRKSEQTCQHHAVFRCPLPTWTMIAEKHRLILAREIGQDDDVLDAGCGWGRLIGMMPYGWEGDYLGVDLSPDFVRIARDSNPYRAFVVGDLRSMPFIPNGRYDWAVLISIRPMIKRNLGDEEWDKMDSELRRVADRLLFLEYDENDNGSVE